MASQHIHTHAREISAFNISAYVCVSRVKIERKSRRDSYRLFLATHSTRDNAIHIKCTILDVLSLLTTGENADSTSSVSLSPSARLTSAHTHSGPINRGRTS